MRHSTHMTSGGREGNHATIEIKGTHDDFIRRVVLFNAFTFVYQKHKRSK